MRLVLLAAFAALTTSAAAETFKAELQPVTEWKAVYGRVEARDMIAARARIGGIVVELTVSEGDTVKAGQQIAVVRDDKIAFQIEALDAQIASLNAQLSTAKDELDRGKALVAKGVTTAQRLDQLKTLVDVAGSQIDAAKAQRSVIVQQGAEGAVLAPGDGRILTVPVSKNAVIMGGEPVATIGGGGFFLRLAIPERHASLLKTNAQIRIAQGSGEMSGRLAKIYPQIENGRVIADVEVENLDTAYVNARVLVDVPVGQRQAILIPAGAVSTRSGIDFITVEQAGKRADRAVVTGELTQVDGKGFIEVLTGLDAGDMVVLPQ
ncbi:MAG: efflux RND transporter periplasmic adaptor subunit [Rhizobiaceae bacterium]